MYLFSNRTLFLILKVESEEKGRLSTVIFFKWESRNLCDGKKGGGSLTVRGVQQ